MRRLSPDEADLWSRVTATIRPLSRNPQSQADLPTPERAPVVVAPRPRQAVTSQQAQQRRAGHLDSTLDGSWDRRLASGSIRPDRIVDLHGHNLDRAWRAIDQALAAAIAAEERVVLLITGHERQGEPPVERGRIRAAVHDWLAASRHSDRIAAVRNAHKRHGGGGSLYLVLRR